MLEIFLVYYVIQFIISIVWFFVLLFDFENNIENFEDILSILSGFFGVFLFLKLYQLYKKYKESKPKKEKPFKDEKHNNFIEYILRMPHEEWEIPKDEQCYSLVMENVSITIFRRNSDNMLNITFLNGNNNSKIDFKTNDYRLYPYLDIVNNLLEKKFVNSKFQEILID